MAKTYIPASKTTHSRGLTFERVLHSGAITISKVGSNLEYLRTIYYGYTKREAESLFRAEWRKTHGPRRSPQGNR